MLSHPFQPSSQIERTHWRPGGLTSTAVSACRVGRFVCLPAAQTYDEQEADALAWANGTPAAPPPSTAAAAVAPHLPPGVPDVSQPRLIVWFQRTCPACQQNDAPNKDTGRSFFDEVAAAAAAMGVTCHRVEVTAELQAAYPHVTIVPLYDLVTPVRNESSPYGAHTALHTMRNNLQELRARFPALRPA